MGGGTAGSGGGEGGSGGGNSAGSFDPLAAFPAVPAASASTAAILTSSGSAETGAESGALFPPGIVMGFLHFGQYPRLPA